MSDDRSKKKLYRNKPEGVRLVGRPRKRWLNEVEQNLKQMEVRGWRRRAQNRDEWQSILKEAKVLHGPQRQGVSQSGKLTDDRSTKKLYSNKPEGLRLVGRPRKRWLDEVEQNFKQMEVRGWRRRAQNRDEWRSILKEAKVLHGP
jgi:hypothetical protein